MINKENIYKIFVKYVSLNILSMIGLSCYILADTYFISSGIGSDGITALNLVLPIYSLINGIGLLFGMGAATRYSIFYGKQDNENASKTFTRILVLGILLGIIFLVLGAFFTNTLISLLGADAIIKPIASEYLKVIFFFAPAFIINNIFVCFVRNDGQPKLAMTAMITGSLSNIILDYLFIFPLNLGMLGAAFATGLAPICSMGILFIHYIKRNNHFHFIKCNLFSKEIIKMLSLGMSAFIIEFSSGIIMLVFNFIILNLAGNTGVAAYGIIANIVLVVMAIFTGIAQGIQPIISVNLGLGNQDNIKKVFRYAVILAVILGAFFAFIGICLPKPIVALFNKQHNKELYDLTIQGIRLYSLSFFIMGINIVTASFFAALTKPVQSFLISMIRGFFAVIPLAFLLSFAFKMKGVWITIPCTEVITVIISITLLVNTFSFSDKMDN